MVGAFVDAWYLARPIIHTIITQSSTLNFWFLFLSSALANAHRSFVPHTRKIGYGLAAAAMLPAIFVQVPSGLSVQGSLVSGLTSADQIVRNTTGNATTLSPANVGSTDLNSIALNVGFSVVQIAIGITVGLFLAALIVYPFGKKRSGLFSF
jgi:uncharacterized membrane protein YjjB (DUF3815 family)